MENHVVNLQDKIQKLIDQYTLDKKKLAELEKLNNELTEENLQLMQQLEDYSKLTTDTDSKCQALQTEIDTLKARNQELENLLGDFDSFAGDAIKKIDEFIPADLFA